MDDWSALEKWTPKYLKAAFGEQQTLAGDYSMSFENFLAYSRRAHDEMPLYLFDKHFADNVPQLADDYKVCLSLLLGLSHEEAHMEACTSVSCHMHQMQLGGIWGNAHMSCIANSILCIPCILVSGVVSWLQPSKGMSRWPCMYVTYT